MSATGNAGLGESRPFERVYEPAAWARCEVFIAS